MKATDIRRHEWTVGGSLFAPLIVGPPCFCSAPPSQELDRNTMWLVSSGQFGHNPADLKRRLVAE
jgi:hypothetical protein